jgi:hypothetical protein
MRLTFNNGTSEELKDEESVVDRLEQIYKAQPVALQGLNGIITDSENRAVRFINEMLVEHRGKGSRLTDAQIEQIKARVR